MKETYIRNAILLEWLDGDTCRVFVDQGFDQWSKQVVRVYGINCPERHSANKVEMEDGLKAYHYAYELIPSNSKIIIQSYKATGAATMEKYGRWLAKIQTPHGTDFGKAMLNANLARPYFGEKRQPWIPLQDKAPPVPDSHGGTAGEVES